MKKQLILLALSALMINPVFATWRTNGQDVPDSTNMKSDGKFGAMMLLVDKNEFSKQWDQPNMPHIIEKKTLKRLENVTMLTVFSGCKEINNTCNVSIDYSIIVPGQDAQSFDNQPLWTEKPLGSNILMLGRAMIENHIDATDPLGVYHVQAIIHDNNAHIDLKLNNEFKVVK